MPAGIATPMSWGPQALKPTIRNWIVSFGNDFKRVYADYMNENTTAEYYEEDQEIAGAGPFGRRNAGGNLNFTGVDLGPKTTIIPEQWQLAIAVTEEDVKFNKVRKLQRMVQALDQSMRTTIEMVACTLLNTAFSSSFPYADAQPLFSASHPLKRAHWVTGEALATNTATAADLTPATLRTARNVLKIMPDLSGQPMNCQATDLVVHSNNGDKARQIVGSSSYYAAAAGDVDQAYTGVKNPAQDYQLRVIESPYLITNTNWFVFGPKSKHRCELLWNMKPDDKTWTNNDIGAVIYSVKMQLIAAATSWWGVYGNSGA